MTTETQGRRNPPQETLHYAACNDCPLWKWTESREAADEAAESHADETGHDAYGNSVTPGEKTA